MFALTTRVQQASADEGEMQEWKTGLEGSMESCTWTESYSRGQTNYTTLHAALTLCLPDSDLCSTDKEDVPRACNWQEGIRR